MALYGLYGHFSKIMVPVLGTLNKRGRLIIGTPKGTIFWRNDHIGIQGNKQNMNKATPGLGFAGMTF